MIFICHCETAHGLTSKLSPTRSKSYTENIHIRLLFKFLHFCMSACGRTLLLCECVCVCARRMDEFPLLILIKLLFTAWVCVVGFFSFFACAVLVFVVPLINVLASTSACHCEGAIGWTLLVYKKNVVWHFVCNTPHERLHCENGCRSAVFFFSIELDCFLCLSQFWWQFFTFRARK